MRFRRVDFPVPRAPNRKKLFCTLYSQKGGQGILLLDFETGENKIINMKFSPEAFSPDGKTILGISMGLNATRFSTDGEILEQFSLKEYFSKGTMLNTCDWSPDGNQLAINTLNQIHQTLLMRNVLK